MALSLILVGSWGDVAGSAPDAATVMVPPFAGDGPTQASSLLAPCREVVVPPAAVPPSDPATGVFSVSVGAKAEDCQALAYSSEESWVVGASPSELVGGPARVRVTFIPTAWGSSGQGTPARFGAKVTLSVAGSAPWTFMAFDCEPGRCSGQPPPTTLPLEPWVFEGTVEQLPAQIGAEFRAEAYVAEGTGEAAMHLTGQLASVAVAPVEGPG